MQIRIPSAAAGRGSPEVHRDRNAENLMITGEGGGDGRYPFALMRMACVGLLWFGADHSTIVSIVVPLWGHLLGSLVSNWLIRPKKELQ